MKTQKIIRQLEDINKANKQPIALKGIALFKGIEKPIFYKTIPELINALRMADERKIYKAEVEVSDYMFLNIKVRLHYLTKEEINKPLIAVKLSRNINAFETHYERFDELKDYEFWANLRKSILNKIATCNAKEIEAIKKLAIPEKAQLFINN